jgi:hypothetical protein
MLKRFVITFVIIIFAATAAQTKEKQGPGASFHDRVAATYNFLPRNLDQKAIEAKSKELDAFWEQVKARGAQSNRRRSFEIRSMSS